MLYLFDKYKLLTNYFHKRQNIDLDKPDVVERHNGTVAMTLLICQ